MSPLDPRTFGSDTPRTLDGRTYPPHLRSYEQFDAQFLPLLAELGQATFDDLSIRVADPKVRSALVRWLASARWRGLVERVDEPRRGPRAYALGPQAQAHLPHAA